MLPDRKDGQKCFLYTVRFNKKQIRSDQDKRSEIIYRYWALGSKWMKTNAVFLAAFFSYKMVINTYWDPCSILQLPVFIVSLMVCFWCHLKVWAATEATFPAGRSRGRLRPVHAQLLVLRSAASTWQLPVFQGVGSSCRGPLPHRWFQ